MTLASIPDPGTWVALRRIESTDWGGVDEEVTALIHPDNLKAALMATVAADNYLERSATTMLSG